MPRRGPIGEDVAARPTSTVRVCWVLLCARRGMGAAAQTALRAFVGVSCGCCNKTPRTGPRGLKQQKFIPTEPRSSVQVSAGPWSL